MTKRDRANPAWPSTGPLFRWSLRLPALAAIGVSGYLAYVTMTGEKAAGCGASALFDCDSVLAGTNSTWLGLPVAGVAVLVYGAIFGVTWRLPAAGEPRPTPWAWPLLITGSTTAAAAGIWFISQQVVQGQFCPFCLTVHACGLAVASAVVVRLIVRDAKDPPWPATGAAGGFAAGLFLVGLLAGGQTLFPADRSQISGAADLPPDPPGVMTVLEGKQRVVLRDFPIIGSPDAPVVLIKLFDYTCPHCKKLHVVLDTFESRYGHQVAVVMAPVPLSRKCNRLMKGDHPKHKDACAFARYGLAVWRADPAKFPDFHEWIFLRPMAPTAQAARSHAIRLVGEEAFTEALRDPWIDTCLKQSIAMWEDCTSRRVPRILTRRHEATFDPPDTIYPFIEQRLAEATSEPAAETATPPATD